jgi:hypothetical protein
VNATLARTIADDRALTIATIRTNLRKRGLKWITVKGDRGTAWGWITICAKPSEGADEYGRMTDEQRAQLAAALGVESVHPQGVSIPASGAYRVEYIERSAGQEPTVIGEPYWD